MKKLFVLSVMLLIAIALFSCKGDTGAVGPAGPTGSANVYSSSLTVQQSQWTNVSGTNDYYDEVSYSAISNGNADLVEVYLLSTNLANSANGWSPLPVSGYYYNVLNGGVELEYYGSGSAPGTVTFNIVVIPPPSLAKMKLHGVNLKDYNQVNAYIKLNSKN